MLMMLVMLLMWLIQVMTKLDSSRRPTMVILVTFDNESYCYHLRRLLIHSCSGTYHLSCWLAATMSPSSRPSLRFDHNTSQRSDQRDQLDQRHPHFVLQKQPPNLLAHGMACVSRPLFPYIVIHSGTLCDIVVHFVVAFCVTQCNIVHIVLCNPVLHDMTSEV